MIAHRRILTGVLVCGALSLVAGASPSAVAAPPAADESRSDAPILRWKISAADGTTATIEVVGADPVALTTLKMPEMTRELWTSFLSVRVLSGSSTDPQAAPPVSGSYRVDGDRIRFEPRYPMEPGVRYLAEFDPVQLHAVAWKLFPGGGLTERDPRTAPRLAAEFSPPKRSSSPSTSVTGVHPSRSTLPENLLRFYIHFSSPMSRGEAYDHVRLLDSTGKPVEAAFLELHEELWSNDGMRFTLLFDPGRIKRGLKPREELGPILEAGKSYELVIDRDWPDANGNPLRGEFRMRFRAGPTDETSPDPKTWTIRPPSSGSRDPLEVRFPEPLDRALLDRLVAVEDAAGKVLPGRVSIEAEETLWRLTPQAPWRPGDYRLVVGTELEDVAGNSVGRPFEVDLVGPITHQVTTQTVARPFRIGPAPH